MTILRGMDVKKSTLWVAQQPSYRSFPFERNRQFPEGTAAGQYHKSLLLKPKEVYNEDTRADTLPCLEGVLSTMFKAQLSKTTYPGPIQLAIPYVTSINAIRRCINSLVFF
jgi:hypothetical protein